MSRFIDKALEYASEKHKGQLDDQGRPYCARDNNRAY
jgi:(p)ppGpp synthase/HD superfamily hydrolase